MSYVDPLYPEDTVDDEPTAADLTVDFEPAVVVATLYGPDGSVLFELLDKSPAGFTLP